MSRSKLHSRQQNTICCDELYVALSLLTPDHVFSYFTTILPRVHGWF